MSHLKVRSQTIQRVQNELTSSLHPSSRILHQLQTVASGLEDQQTSFIKNMEYYMYHIGVQFETSPLLHDRIKPTTDAPPPIPPSPSQLPTRSIAVQQTIIQLKDDLLKRDQELNLKICANTELESSIADLEESLHIAESRINGLHSDMSTLREYNMDLRKIVADCAQTKAKPESDPTLLSTTQANIQAC